MLACGWKHAVYVQLKKLNGMHMQFNYERSIRIYSINSWLQTYCRAMYVTSKLLIDW